MLVAREEIVDRSIETEKHMPASFKAWSIICCGWAFYLYEYILRVLPTVITNELMGQFNITAFTVGSLASIYYWSYVPLQVPCGMIIDKLGPRKVVTFSTFLCVIGTIMFSQSSSLTIAYIGRFIVGAGSACAYISCLKVGTQWFKPSYFPLIVGSTVMMGTLGGMFATKPFAILVNTFGWRHAMLIASGVGVVIGLICWFVMRDRTDKAETPQTEAGLMTGIRNVIKKPQNWLLGMYACLVYIPLAAFADLWGVPYFMKRYDLTNEAASTGSIIVYLGIAIGCLLGSAVSEKMCSRKKVMSLSSMLTFAGFSAVLFMSNLSYNIVLFILFIAGSFSGLSFMYFASAKESNPIEYSATAVGFVNGLCMTCPIIFQPLLGGLIDYSWDGSFDRSGAPAYTLENYEFALGAVLVGLLLSRVLLFFIKETYKQPEEVQREAVERV